MYIPWWSIESYRRWKVFPEWFGNLEIFDARVPVGPKFWNLRQKFTANVHGKCSRQNVHGKMFTTSCRHVRNICPSSAKSICYFSVCHWVVSQGSTSSAHNNRGARGWGGPFFGSGGVWKWSGAIDLLPVLIWAPTEPYGPISPQFPYFSYI